MSSPLKVYSNRYEIVRPIARGGMADVYLARDQLLNRPVALKVLFPEFAREASFVERFRREAQAAANLNHPNIVGIYDWGQEQGTYFIAMEYVEGRSLREVLSSQGRISASQAAEIGAEIGAALAFAHRNGVVHRDVKPGNVLLTTEGQVKVTDFGIARAGTSDALTQTGSVMGTATYFSPEQAQGMTVDGRSDVYSLGIVLYEMVAGNPPFVADTPVAVAYKQVQEAHTPLGTQREGVSPDYAAIVDRALAKRVADRYQSAEDLRSDLLRFRRGQKISHAAVTGIVAEMDTGEIQRAAPATTAAATEMHRTIPVAQRPEPDWDYPDDHSTSVGRRVGIALVVLLALGLVGAVAAILLSSPDSTNTANRNIEVPPLIGLTEENAIAALRSKGFKTIDDPRPVKSDQPIGIVVAQDPPKGEIVGSRERIRIDVSAGPETVKVPSGLTNVSREEAEQKLTAVGLLANPVLEASDDIDLGRVIRTDPPSGSDVPLNSKVTVVLSAGKADIPLPRLEGYDLQAAVNALKSKGFVGEITNEPQASTTIEKGLVINTDPAFGESAKADDAIVIYISAGPETKDMISVRGLDEATAITTLRNAGFTLISTSDVVAPDAVSVGKVVRQDPSSGPWETNKPVTIYIGIASTSSSSSSSSSVPSSSSSSVASSP